MVNNSVAEARTAAAPSMTPSLVHSARLKRKKRLPLSAAAMAALSNRQPAAGTTKPSARLKPTKPASETADPTFNTARLGRIPKVKTATDRTLIEPAADAPEAAAPLAEAGRETGATDPLLGPTPLLPLSLSRLPAPLTGVATSPLPPPAPMRRWSLALLAGPGLTYRQLAPRRDSSGTNDIGRYEQVAVGYSVQAQVGYALTPRLRLSTGLGYTEYATRFNATITRPVVQRTMTWHAMVIQNGPRRDTVRWQTTQDSLAGYQSTALRQRDTYRYLTIPLQLQWQLGSTGRLSYGALAGASLGIYYGGRFTSGTGCACEQLKGGSPSYFRSSTLLLSLGAAAEYEWRPGWHLQLQPVLSYSAFSIMPGAQPARRPVGLFLQTGLRIDIR